MKYLPTAGRFVADIIKELSKSRRDDIKIFITW
jgi:hypothetical protein